MLKLIKAGVFDSYKFFENVEQTPERIVNFYEIELYISGEGESVIDSKSYTHKKGNLLFVRPGQVRYSKKSFVCFYVHIDVDSDTAKLLYEVSVVSNVINYSQYKACFTEVIHAYENSDQYNSFYLQSKLFELLNLISNNSKLELRRKNMKINADPSIIQNAAEYIETHYSENITLEDIAKYINFSPSYFHKIFKAYMGKTPHMFLLEKRLSSAKTFLLTTNLSLNEIVSECGFSSHSYFDYNFKMAYGITPSEFRNQKYII